MDGARNVGALHAALVESGCALKDRRARVVPVQRLGSACQVPSRRYNQGPSCWRTSFQERWYEMFS